MKRGIDAAVAEAAKPLDVFTNASVPTFKLSFEDLVLPPGKPFLTEIRVRGIKPRIDTGKFQFAAELVKPFRKVFEILGDMAAPFDDLRDAMGELEKLKALQRGVDGFRQQVVVIADQAVAFAETVGTALRIVGIALAVLGVWLALNYLLWAQGRLATGLAMMRGR